MSRPTLLVLTLLVLWLIVLVPMIFRRVDEGAQSRSVLAGGNTRRDYAEIGAVFLFVAASEVPDVAEQFGAVPFDLDGVLTNTAAVHAAAWKQTFDDFLRKRDGAVRRNVLKLEIEPHLRNRRRHLDRDIWGADDVGVLVSSSEPTC